MSFSYAHKFTLVIGHFLLHAVSGTFLYFHLLIGAFKAEQFVSFELHVVNGS